MKNNKKIVSMILVFVLMLSTFTTVLAADRDLVHKETKEKKVFEEYLLDDSFIYELLVEGALEDYYVEVNEKLYNSAEVQEKFDEDPTVTLKEAVVGLDSVEEPTEELEVVKVSAIDKTVTLNVASFDYDVEDEDVKANVAFFELDEEGEVAEDATADLKGDYDIEDGIVVVDVRTLADGDYKIVVTIGEEVQEAVDTIDFAAADELLDKVVNASSAATLAPLLEGNFEDYDEANIDEYVIKRDTQKLAGKLNTLADVQKLVIDAANAEAEVRAEFDTLVTEVKEAKTSLAKYNVIKSYFAEYVNDNNMDAYLTAILEDGEVDVDNDVDSMEAIQEIIDGTNFDAVEAEFITGTTLDTDIDENSKLDELLAALEALEALKVVDEDVQEAIDELVEDIEAQIEAIDEAKEDALEVIEAAKEAMADFEVAFGEDFAEETEYEAVADAIEALEVILAKEDVTEKNITDKLNGTKDDFSINEIDDLEKATKVITIEVDADAALEAYLEAGGEESDQVYEDVTDAVAALDVDDEDTIEALDEAIEALEEATRQLVVYADVMAAKTAEEMRALLFEFEDPNYVNLTSAQKLEFAGMFIEAIVDADDADKEDYSDIATLLGTEVTTNYATLIDNVNVATSISAMIAALEAISADYDALGAQAKADIAEALLEEVPFATMAEIEAAMGL